MMLSPSDFVGDGYGIWLGYPQCCIDAFKILSHIPKGRAGSCGPRERRLLCGTGFVPCRTCSENNTEQELIDKINANRQKPIPFKAYTPKKV